MVEASVDEGEAKASAASLHLQCQLLHDLLVQLLGLPNNDLVQLLQFPNNVLSNFWVSKQWFVQLLGFQTMVPKSDLASSWTGGRLFGC